MQVGASRVFGLIVMHRKEPFPRLKLPVSGRDRLQHRFGRPAFAEVELLEIEPSRKDVAMGVNERWSQEIASEVFYDSRAHLRNLRHGTSTKYATVLDEHRLKFAREGPSEVGIESYHGVSAV